MNAPSNNPAQLAENPVGLFREVGADAPRATRIRGTVARFGAQDYSVGKPSRVCLSGLRRRFRRKEDGPELVKNVGDVSALPIKLVAGRTPHETFLRLENKRGHSVLNFLSWDGFERGVAEKTPGEETLRGDFQFQLGDDLFQLLNPVIARDEEASSRAGVARNVRISRQDDPVFLDSSSDKLLVLDLREVKRVEPENPQPPRELRQMVIRDQPRRRFGLWVGIS